MLEKLKNYFSLYAVRNLSFLSFSQVVKLTAGMLYSILVVRFLGGVVYGQLLVVISSAKILDQILHLKLEKPLTSLLRQSLDNDEMEEFHARNTAAVLLTFLSSSLGFVVLAVAGLVEYQFDFFELNWFFYSTLFFGSMFVRHLRNIIFTNFQAGQLFGNLGYLNIVSTCALNFLPLLFLQYEILGICLGYLLAEIFILLSFTLLMAAPFSEAKSVIPRLNYSWDAIRGLFDESWKYYQAKLLDRVSENFSNIFIAYAGGPKTLAFFNIGKKFFKFNVVVFPALNNYLFPRLVQKWNERRDEFFYTLRKYLLTSSVYTLLLLGVLSLVVPYILPFFYGVEFRPAVTAFLIMVPGYLLGVPPGNIFREVCFATDNIRTYRALKFVANPLYLLVLYPLTVYFGFAGAALAWSLRKGGIGLFDGWWLWRLSATREA